MNCLTVGTTLSPIRWGQVNLKRKFSTGSDYIRFKGVAFNVHKINEVYCHKRFFYITHPYKLIVEYQKKNTLMMIGPQNMLVPITLEATAYSWKYKSKEKCIEDANWLRKIAGLPKNQGPDF